MGDLGAELLGRSEECNRLAGMVAASLTGVSQVCVLRGEAGVGKTALLNHLVESTSGVRLARTSGSESEMELPYAGLQQLCIPLLDHLTELPVPQRDALTTAFGLG